MRGKPEASTLVWIFLLIAIGLEIFNVWRIDRYIRRAEAADLRRTVAMEEFKAQERQNWAVVQALAEAAAPTMALMDARLRWWDREKDRGYIVAVEKKTFNRLMEAIEHENSIQHPTR